MSCGKCLKKADSFNVSSRHRVVDISGTSLSMILFSDLLVDSGFLEGLRHFMWGVKKKKLFFEMFGRRPCWLHGASTGFLSTARLFLAQRVGLVDPSTFFQCAVECGTSHFTGRHDGDNPRLARESRTGSETKTDGTT